MSQESSVPLAEACGRIDSFCEKYRRCVLQVRSRGVFTQDAWLDVGSVDMPPADVLQTFASAPGGGKVGPSSGHYLLHVSPEIHLRASFFEASGITDNDADWKKASEVLQDTLRRSLLLPVLFDDESITRLRKGRPCSVVVDTSGIRQGAVSFLIQYCQPFARLKIPPILTMEIEEKSHQFLRLDRTATLTPKKKMKLLEAQASSQSVFRLLQQAQHDGSIVFEPAMHPTDPLRSIFQPESDGEFQGFNFHEVSRGFADRLILESAREHLRLFGSGYDVMMLTSDQGMARLALAEGLGVIYFEARQAFSPFGRSLPGVHYSLLSDFANSVPLEDLLWELATSFGAARLYVDADTHLRVQSHPLRVAWSPAISRGDRLDVFISESVSETQQVAAPGPEVEVAPAPAGRSDAPPAQASPKPSAQESRAPSKKAAKKQAKSKTSKTSSERVLGTGARGAAFSAQKLIGLVVNLERSSMDRLQAAQSVGLNTGISLQDYLAFLRSIGAISTESSMIVLTADGHGLFEALRTRNFEQLYAYFCRAASFASFMSYLFGIETWDANWLANSPIRREAQGNYRDLGDLCTMLYSSGRSAYVTPLNPVLEEFVQIALSGFREASDSDGYADSTLFLEGMAKRAVHPTVVRDLLKEAARAGLLHVSYQGAIPRVERNGPQVMAIDLVEGQPVVRKYALQEGNFLSEEHASLRLRVEEMS
jgi:hypothetical protein